MEQANRVGRRADRKSELTEQADRQTDGVSRRSQPMEQANKAGTQVDSKGVLFVCVRQGNTKLLGRHNQPV